MTSEVRRFSVTIPAGTAVAAGFTSPLSFPSRIVTEIRVRVPPGPRGEVGFGIGNSGVITVPYGGGSYIVTDDEDLDFPLTDAVQSGSWTFFGYNTGNYNHTIQVYFSCDPIPAPGTGIPPALDIGSGPGSGGGVPGNPTTGTPGGCTDTGGNIVDCPPGTPPGTVLPPAGPPGGPPPPVIAPPSPPGIPIILPPISGLPPGLGGGSVYDSDDPLLIAVPDLGQVWLLDAESYRMVATQDDANALLDTPTAAAMVSTAAHQAILKTSAGYLGVMLGPEGLGGHLVYTREKG